jgi:transcriptional regulator with XRE-family HTH domain
VDTDEELARRFGRQISDARKVRQWSQEALAERLGVSTTHVGFMERGERMPSVGMLVKAARVLDLSLDAIFLPRPGATDQRRDELVALAAGVSPAMRGHALALLRSLARESAPAAPAPKRRRRRA